MEQIMTAITAAFDTAKDGGIKIVIAAIGIGAIFIGARFIWGMARKWLNKAQ